MKWQIKTINTTCLIPNSLCGWKEHAFILVTPNHSPVYQLSMDGIFAISSGKENLSLKKKRSKNREKELLMANTVF